jgi:hypothetical protein
MRTSLVTMPAARANHQDALHPLDSGDESKAVRVERSGLRDVRVSYFASAVQKHPQPGFQKKPTKGR